MFEWFGFWGDCGVFCCFKPEMRLAVLVQTAVPVMC